MNVRLSAPPWESPELTKEAIEAIEIIGNDVWRDSSIAFYSMRDAKMKQNKNAPKGMQKYLNEVLCKRFSEKGWEGD